MDFEDLFTELGDYGKYQKLMLWFVLLPAQFPYGCQLYCLLFMSITPDHWCKVSLLNHLNVTENFNRHLFVPKRDNVLHSTQYEQCLAYNISYETLVFHSIQIGWIPNQTWPVTQCSEGWIYNRTLLGMDDSIITKWNLVCDKSWMPVLLYMLFFTGAFCGQLLLILTTNKFGNKKTYLIMLTLECLFGVLITFSSKLEIFSILLFAMGVTVPSIASIPSALSLELCPQWKRTNVMLLNEASRNFGALLLLAVSYLIRDYNHLIIAISGPFLIFISYWWVFPESPKWLILQKRIEQLDKLVRDVAQTNAKHLSPDFSISLRRRIRIECAIYQEVKANHPTNQLIRLIAMPNMRRKFFILCFLWITNVTTNIGLTYYVPHFSEDRGNGDIYFPFLIAICGNCLGLLMAPITLKSCGRKCAVCITNILSGLFSIMSAITKEKNQNLCLIYFASAKISLICSSGVLSIWMYELFPGSVRTQVIYFCDTLGYMGLILIPLLIFYGNRFQIHLIQELTLTGSLIIFGLLVIFSGLPSLTLPDTSEIDPPKTLDEAESFGKYWSWKDMFRCKQPKKEPRNGILKNRGPQPQSPILSLLRKQEMMRQNEYDMELDKISELNDSPNRIYTIKVTVL